MIRFKDCPRCRGDLYLETAAHASEELSCLQCGYISYSDPRPKAVARITAWRRAARDVLPRGGPLLVIRDGLKDAGHLPGTLLALGYRVRLAPSYEQGERDLAFIGAGLVLIEGKTPSIGVLAMAKRIKALRPDLTVAILVHDWDDGEELACRAADFAALSPLNIRQLRWTLGPDGLSGAGEAPGELAAASSGRIRQLAS